MRVLHRPRKEGLGQAYLAGFELALRGGAELVLEMDADFSHDPAYLPRMIEAARDADLVLGSRYVPGGGVRNWGRLRSFVSRGGCWYARTVLGVPIRDLTGGFKCFRREVLEALDLEPDPLAGLRVPGRAHLPALCSWASGSKEIPIVFTDRRVGQSKMSRRIVLEAIWMIPALRRQPVPAGKASSNEVSRV